MDFRIYFLYIKNDIKSQLKYPLDFCIQMIVWMVYTMIPFAGLSILFSRFGAIGKWNLYKVALMYAIVGISYDLSRMIGRGFDDFHKLLIKGELDDFLIRPFGLFFQILGSKLFLRRLSGIITYGIILVSSLNIVFSKDQRSVFFAIPIILLTMIGTTAVFMGLLTFYATSCIFTFKKNFFSDIFIDSVSKVGYLPLDYMSGIKYLFIFMIPLYFTMYKPIKSLCFTQNYQRAFSEALIGILLGCGFLWIAKEIFYKSMRFYRSCNN